MFWCNSLTHNAKMSCHKSRLNSLNLPKIGSAFVVSSIFLLGAQSDSHPFSENLLRGDVQFRITKPKACLSQPRVKPQIPNQERVRFQSEDLCRFRHKTSNVITVLIFEHDPQRTFRIPYVRNFKICACLGHQTIRYDDKVGALFKRNVGQYVR